MTFLLGNVLYAIISPLKEVQLLPITSETLARGKVELLVFMPFFQWRRLIYKDKKRRVL